MKHIEEAIYEVAANDIQAQKKSIVFPVILVVLGAVMLALNFGVDALGDNSNLSSMLLVVGASLLFAGTLLALFRVFGSARDPYYVPTGESLEEISYCFEDCHRAKVEQAVRDCDIAALARIPQVDSAPMMVQIFATSSHSAVAMQLLRYVPHNYEPIGEVYFKFTKK